MTNILSLMKLWKNSTLLQKSFYVMLILIIIVILTKWLSNEKEGFKDISNKEFIIHKDINVFDKFYVSVYDDLMHRTGRNDFEIGEITQVQPSKDEGKLLDVGSGTGHHVAAFSKKGFIATGVDMSQAMVDKAKENYPDNDFIKGDVMDSMLFNPSSFTHITCLYFTIYYMKDKNRFFNNTYEWLKPGGFLIIHLVDREKFDPIIPAANPFTILSPQNYADKRITTSVVKFDDFDYKCKFDLVGDVATINETFKNKNNENIRQNEHTLYMNSQKNILSMAKSAGFILHSKIDMIECQHDNNYLYILKKPD